MDVIELNSNFLYPFDSDGGFVCNCCASDLFYTTEKKMSVGDSLFKLIKCTQCCEYLIENIGLRKIINDSDLYFDILTKFFYLECNNILGTKDIVDFSYKEKELLKMNGLSINDFL